MTRQAFARLMAARLTHDGQVYVPERVELGADGVVTIEFEDERVAELRKERGA